MDKDKEFFSVTELAEWLSVGPMTIHRMVKRGDIPAYQVGKLFRFRRADIEEWLARHRVNPGPRRPAEKEGDE